MDAGTRGNWEVRSGSVGGRGVFATRDVPVMSLVGEYLGEIKRSEEVMKRSRVGEEVPRRVMIEKLRYLMPCYDEGLGVLDLVDDEGELMPEFDYPCTCIGHLVNEPPSSTAASASSAASLHYMPSPASRSSNRDNSDPTSNDDVKVDGVAGQTTIVSSEATVWTPNACFVQNWASKRVEVRSIRRIRCGDEVLAFYGSGVYRDYDISESVSEINNIGMTIDALGKVSVVAFDGEEFAMRSTVNEEEVRREAIARLKEAVRRKNVKFLDELVQWLETEGDSLEHETSQRTCGA